jgi:diguanylate cyclase (GGDEF)-like protein
VKATATLADLYQDARFHATAADESYQEYLYEHLALDRVAQNQAFSDLDRTLRLLATSPRADRPAVQRLQAAAVAFAVATGKAEDLAADGDRVASDRVDATEVAASNKVLVQTLYSLEEAAQVAGKADLARVARAGSWLSRATPIVLAGSLLAAALLFSVLRRYRRRIETLAVTDPLTELPNRLGLAHRAARLLSSADPTDEYPALLLLDLDRFKEVNDSLGHHYGDQLLIQVGQRLRRSVKSTDLVARLGGDEFAILLAKGGEAAGRVVADRVRTMLHQPFVMDQLTVDVGVSVGIAVATAETHDLPALMRCADVAMYVAKESGDGAVVYTHEHDARTADKVRLLSELRRALDHDELVVHYQPKVALDDGRLLGVEALVRWQHPTDGMLAPGAFIPVVEDTELMDRLTTDVLTKALRQTRAWADQGDRIPVAVNIPTRSLLNLAFPTMVEGLLTEFGVAANMLCLEITESSAMRDPERCIAVLSALRATGVRISIDDYGTGYASMSYLKDLPIDELKIDRSFIARMADDPNSAILARSVVELGHNLGLTVVGEGVEDATTGELLHDTGCDSAQGYHYARPMPGNEVLSWTRLNHALGQTRLPRQRSDITGVSSDKGVAVMPGARG